MAISTEEVEKISKLARLKFSANEIQKFTQELSQILDYVDQIKTLSEKVDENKLIDESALNLMRNDVAEPTPEPEVFLEQAPAREGNYIKVKSVLE